MGDGVKLIHIHPNGFFMNHMTAYELLQKWSIFCMMDKKRNKNASVMGNIYFYVTCSLLDTGFIDTLLKSTKKLLIFGVPAKNSFPATYGPSGLFGQVTLQRTKCREY